ncbi:uracil-DNA glycosylase [Fusobacterium sp.]|uniref:uracil-DNA glycosylase n=1 Tax=Fusobacterium sp. TaxID=68766 RepID=UPI00261284DC|nr:uracil-DNA glycosylase [Fusobacterium sp.]
MEKKELWEEFSFEINNIPKIRDSFEDEGESAKIGSGNKNANLLFIGDESDLYESADLKVGVGSNGEFLLKLCDMAEFTPEDYYITTLTKCNIKYKDLFPEEQQVLRDFLDMQIAIIEPKIIVALGHYSAECLLKREVDFGKERGKLMDWKGGIKVLVTYDVRYVKEARENTGRKSTSALEFWKDLLLVKKEIDKINSPKEDEKVGE